MRVLLIERDRARTERLRRALQRSPLARFELSIGPMPASAAEPADAPDVVIVDVGIRNGSDAADAGRVRDAFPASALVLFGDPDAVRTAAAHESVAHDCIPASNEAMLDSVAAAAAAGNRRTLDLRRRVRHLEIGERNLSSLVTTTSDGIMIVDMDGRVCFANPAALQIFGRTATQLIGEPFGFPLVTGDTTVIDIFRRDNGARVVELRATRTQWEGGPARLAALRDITERVRAQDRERELMREHARRMAAEQSERRTRLLSEATKLLASTLDGIQALQDLADLIVPELADCCLFDIVETDGAFERVAISAHGDAGAVVQQLRAGVPRFQSAQGAARALRDGEPWTAEDCADPEFIAALGVPDGAVPFARGRASGLLMPMVARGQPVGALLLIRFREREAFSDPELMLIRELAQRAAVAVDNSRLYRQAEEAARAKADFLAVMSHELRTPLNAIMGYAELLTIGVPVELPQPSLEQVSRIRTSATHLLRLINEILSFSSLEDGRTELELETADVGAIVAEVVSMLDPLATSKDVALRSELTGSRDAVVETDPHKLRQILLNLVGNAIKFTDDGAITVRIAAEAQHAVISVHDTGCGIAAQDIDRIFHPFWQAEQSRTRRAEGTGLGLAVARRLAHLLAGDINVESHPGNGSEFTLRLPWRYPEAGKAVERGG